MAVGAVMKYGSRFGYGVEAFFTHAGIASRLSDSTLYQGWLDSTIADKEDVTHVGYMERGDQLFEHYCEIAILIWEVKRSKLDLTQF